MAKAGRLLSLGCAKAACINYSEPSVPTSQEAEALIAAASQRFLLTSDRPTVYGV